MRVVLWVGLAAAAVCAANPAADAARRWRTTREAAILAEFTSLLALPNVARNLDDMRRNADAIETMFARRGVALRRLEAPGAPPYLYGELRTPGAAHTYLFYAHYDGQPVEPSQWTVTQPFAPLIKDGYVWARSASDDKAPFIALTSALDALRDARIGLRANIRFLFDGEEEAGSPHISGIVSRHRDLLRTDAWIFCDGPVHQNGSQQVVFGARGDTSVDLVVYGPKRELHSGHYGNWAPNPAVMLAHLLASMKDDETGKVLVKDFYKDVVPLSEAEQRAIAGAPRFDAELRRELLLGRTEGDGRRLDELINLPALNVQGLSSGGTGGQMRNVIPDTATASVGLRLVKGTDWRLMQDRVIEHVRSRGYHVVESEPDASVRLQYPRVCRVIRRSGYNGVRAPMDSAVAKRIVSAVEQARGRVIQLPSLGGSLPIAPITEILDVPVVIVPIANHDNNQHGHNENIRIRNLWDGIETMAALLVME